MRWTVPDVRWAQRCAFVIALLGASPAYAQDGFETLAGVWTGNGAVQTSDGAHERVKCRANYDVKSGGRSVALELRCASDAYKFDLNSNLVQDGETLTGNWFEVTHRVGGRISGRNVDGRIEARAEGDTFTALLTVGTKANRQSFLMESPGAMVSQVSIDLVKGSSR